MSAFGVVANALVHIAKGRSVSSAVYCGAPSTERFVSIAV
jgi:hypothetical protein